MFYFYSIFFFFKQKTAYEMRISDWSSDVCSSDLQKVLTLCKNNSTSSNESNLVHASSLQLSAEQDATTIAGAGRERGGHFSPLEHQEWEQIGRASCRERVCQYV